jgi:SET domain-containing protein 6
LKALKKTNPETFADKRKRDEISSASILQALTAKLAQYPTSTQEDKALLKKDGISKRHRMAIEVRLGEKELLHEAVALLQGAGSAEEEADGERATKKAKTKACMPV